MFFADALRQQLIADPPRKRRAKRLLAILDSPPSDRRDRQLARMERHVRAHLGLDPVEAINWSSIDWFSVIEDVLKFLLAILPFLLAL